MRNHIEQFGAAARTYNEAGELQRHVAARLAEHIADDRRKAESVLEIGCGTGFLTRHLRDHFGRAAHYMITDAAPEMVEVCEDIFINPRNMKFAVMDGERPRLARQFDVIASSMAFQWFDNPKTSISELKNYMTRNGSLYYAMPGRENFTEWREHLEHMGLDSGMRDLLDELPGQYREEFITRAYGDEQNGKAFIKMLKDTGAGAPKPDYEKPSPRDFYKAVDSFNGEVTWHIVYGKLTNG